MNKRGSVFGGVTAFALTVALPVNLALADVVTTTAAAPQSAAAAPAATTAAPQAQAAAAAAGTTTAASPEVRTTLDYLALTYWGVYYGPSIAQHNQFQPTAEGNDGDPQVIDGYITVGARPTKDTLVGLGVAETLTPVMEKDVTMKDMFIKIQDTKLISSGGFNLNAYVRTYVPTTAKSQANQLLASTRFDQVWTYDPPNTRWEFGMYTFVRPYFYSAGGTGPQITYDVSPFINYTLTPTVQATLWTDVAQLTAAKGGSPFDVNNAEADIEPGISWDITPKLTINPYLNIYPANLSLQATSIQAVVVAKVL